MILGLSLVSSPALAAEENDSDRNYSLSDPYNQLHLVGSFAFCLTSTLILEHYEVPRWKAVLISLVTTMALGVAKEYWMDSEVSKKDIYMDLAGASTAGLLTFVFRF